MSVENQQESIPAIEFRSVSVSFDEGEPVLDRVSFKLETGHMLVITGASGSGKSVLMRLAAGLLEPDEGEVLINGRRIDRMNETQLLALRSSTIGFVFQEDSLFSGISVYENAAFRLVEHGWSEEDTDRGVMEILRFVGLDQDTEKLPEELSIGMRRRLELARALTGWPSIMLFDEPTSGLDPLNSKQVLNLVIRARDVHQISSLYVTKELHEIPYLGNHYAREIEDGTVEVLVGKEGEAATLQVIMLDRARIAFAGSPEEFAASHQPEVLHLTHPEAEHDLSRLDF